MKKIIYVDMDGVISDFDKAAKEEASSGMVTDVTTS